MPVYETLDSLDSIPEDQRSDYKEDNGKYVRDITEIYTKTLANASKKDEIDKHRIKAEQELAEYKRIEQEKLDTARQEAAKEAYEKAKKEGNFDQLEKSWSEKVEAERKRLADLESKYDKATRQAAVKDIVRSQNYAKGTDRFVRLLESELMNETVQIEVDGQTQLRIKGSDGNPTAVTLQEHFTKLLDSGELDHILAGSHSSGAGSNGQSGRNGAGSNGQKTWANTTSAYKVNLKRTDPAAYEALKNTK